MGVWELVRSCAPNERGAAIGTYSAAHQSWLWVWANEEFPPVAKESAATCQTAGNVFTGQHR